MGPSTGWVRNLTEVGTTIRDAAAAIDSKEVEAQALEKRAAVLRAEAETAYSALVARVKTLWTADEISLAKQIAKEEREAHRSC